VTRPASHHEEAGACGRPPDGAARPRNSPIPAGMAIAASQSRRCTRSRRPMTVMKPKTSRSSSARTGWTRTGWTRASGPNRRALIWKTNPRIMLASPSSQTGRRARRKTSQTSKPALSYLLAPKRWHTEAVAVQKLAAGASRTAFSSSGGDDQAGEVGDGDEVRLHRQDLVGEDGVNVRIMVGAGVGEDVDVIVAVGGFANG